jgi:hypothetical protein
MIHRKASFEFLRDRGIRGPDRQRFFDATYGRNTHGRAIVLEHRHFVRAMCSFICVEDLCGPGSLQQIREYERIYNRYWFARAAVHMGGAGAQGLVRTAGVLDELRRKAVIARQRLLAVAPSSEDVLTLAELRQPTGDTLRLPALRLRRDRA